MANEIKGIKINGIIHKVDYPSTVNRPFGVESRELWLSEQMVEFNEEDNSKSQNYLCYTNEVKTGDIFYCTLDGTEYECIYREGEDGGGAEIHDSIWFWILSSNDSDSVLFFYSDDGPVSTPLEIKLERKVISQLPGYQIGGYELAESIDGGTLTFSGGIS